MKHNVILLKYFVQFYLMLLLHPPECIGVQPLNTYNVHTGINHFNHPRPPYSWLSPPTPNQQVIGKPYGNSQSINSDAGSFSDIFRDVQRQEVQVKSTEIK